VHYKNDRGPCNSFHCLGHSKNVYDDDDDDDDDTCVLPLCIVRYCGTVTKKVNMANNHFTFQDKRMSFCVEIIYVLNDILLSTVRWPHF